MLARLFPLDHEGRQDRTGRRRAANTVRRKRIQRKRIPQVRPVVAQLDFGDETGEEQAAQYPDIASLAGGFDRYCCMNDKTW